MSKLSPEVALPSDPCPVGFVPVNDGSMTAEMFRQWLSIRDMACGPRVFFDRITGYQLTDAEILERVFNGSGVAVVPIYSSILFLVSSLFLIWMVKK